MNIKPFEHGQKVVVIRSAENHALGSIVKLSGNEELVRLNSGELRIFHSSKIMTQEAYSKRKDRKS